MDQTAVYPSRSLVRLTGAVLMLCATGCATLGENGAEGASSDPPPPTPPPSDLLYTVEPGDALAAIAARFTGDATRWRAIAAHNGIEEPRRLAVGQRIAIPASLIPTATNGTAASMAGSATEPSSSPATLRSDGSEGSALPERDEPVVLSAINTNRRFDLDPLQQPGVESAERLVKVIGTYYPIALYAEPRNGSRLAQRVAPGTLLELQRELGDWLQVIMESEVGYLRRRDGEVLFARDLPADAE